MSKQALYFTFQLLLQLAIIIVTSYGLYISLYGAFSSFQGWQLLYYTNLSNLAILILFAVLFGKNISYICQNKKKDCHTQLNNAYLFKIQAALTWAICITGIVWHTLLVPFIKNHPEIKTAIGAALPNAFDMTAMLQSFELLHTWSPLLTFLFWLLFCPKGRITSLMPIIWLLIPASYFIFICIWVYMVGPVNQQLNIIYPYPFIDFANYPALTIWRNIIVIALGMLLLAYIFWGIDHLLKRWIFHIDKKSQ